ncbi:peptidylprolyl isomerase [Paenibacillus agri]|uniref:peptidylprolyl isomerase n=1 Tax=Paenibacillus agri TaxID=2744309 RepID=A0A850EGI5_9BACL|nr:peptidylprolyl isomerase [Paenibacillus agri]NUU59516.1 peptidyl-prolyl cis-trans isomerase [Paenibacillus agri]
MMTRQERALRNAVVLLAAATLVCGGLLIWSLRAMAVLEGNEGDSESPDVAAAGGQEITEQQWIAELKKKHGYEVLLEIINHIVVGQEAQTLGIQVTDAEVKRELERVIAGYPSEEQYYAQMQSELGLSRNDVREETVYRLTLQAIATVGITINDSDIDSYLEQNEDRYRPKREMQLSMIEVSTYKMAQRVMDRLEKGEDFAALAKELSINEESRLQGGNLGTVEEDDPFWPKELLSTAAGLDIGDIAGPLQTEAGYAVIRLEHKIERPVPDTEEIRSQIRQELALEQAPTLRQVESDLRLKYETLINIDNGLEH